MTYIRAVTHHKLEITYIYGVRKGTTNKLGSSLYLLVVPGQEIRDILYFLARGSDSYFISEPVCLEG